MDKTYEVAKILERKKEKGAWKYRIRWKGYSASDDSWEPASCLAGCAKLLLNFQQSLKKQQAVEVISSGSEDATDSDDDYVVDQIIQTKMAAGKRKFKVRWRGYSEDCDSWEPEEGINHTPAYRAWAKAKQTKAKTAKKKKPQSKPTKRPGKSAGKKKPTRKGVKRPKISQSKPKKSGKEEAEESEDSEDSEETDDEGFFRVEKLLDMKIIKGKRMFRVRWKGYQEDEDTWESVDTLSHTDAYGQFQQSHPQFFNS